MACAVVIVANRTANICSTTEQTSSIWFSVSPIDRWHGGARRRRSRSHTHL